MNSTRAVGVDNCLTCVHTTLGRSCHGLLSRMQQMLLSLCNNAIAYELPMFDRGNLIEMIPVKPASLRFDAVEPGLCKLDSNNPISVTSTTAVPPCTHTTSHGLCRFDRENLIIVPQVRKFGYRYHSDGKRFDRVMDSETRLSGSGYALQQLTWDREAYVMATNYTARAFLQGSVMDQLRAKKVQ